MKAAKIALVSLILFGCETAAPSAFYASSPSWSVQQRRIATINQPAEVLISNDLEHVAAIDQHGQKQCLIVDGKMGPQSDAIQGSDPADAREIRVFL